MSLTRSLTAAVLLAAAGCSPLPPTPPTGYPPEPLALGPADAPRPARTVRVPRMTGTPPGTGGPVVAVVPRSARDQYIRDFCTKYPLDRDCADFSANRARWTESRYERWLTERRLDQDPSVRAIFAQPGPVAAAPSLPITYQTNADGIVMRPRPPTTGPAHVTACKAAFRSYDVATDTYVGYDNVRRTCPL